MKVLIVDSDPVGLLRLKRLVSRFDECQPVAMASVQAALGWCRASEPDLVLADCPLPSLEGLELLRFMRSDEALAHVPFLAVTPSGQPQVRGMVLAAGASDVITQPFDQAELQARMGNLLALLASRRRLKEETDGLLLHLSRLAEFRDHETGTHISHMARYARLIAAKLGWDEEGQESILLAAPMHDIGKVVIPDHILMKPGRLSDAEYAVMQSHSQLGYEILRGSKQPVIQLATEIALTHHERVDGSGYPHGLRNGEIPLSARIVAVADVFDALTSPRPYKEAWPFERAQAYLNEGRGTHFDAACIDGFFSDIGDIRAIQRGFAEESGTQSSEAPI